MRVASQPTGADAVAVPSDDDDGMGLELPGGTVEELDAMAQRRALELSWTQCEQRRLLAERGLEGGEAMDLKTGWDFDKEEDRNRAWDYITKERPKLIIGSPPWTIMKMVHMQATELRFDFIHTNLLSPIQWE